MNWLAQNWGNLASVIGLVLSICAVILSNKAKTAANGAKRAVELRSLATALRSCSDEIALLEPYLETQDWVRGDTVAGHAQRELSYITTRWQGQLDAKSAEDLAVASTHLEQVRAQMRKYRSRRAKNNELVALQRTAERIVVLLAAEVGKSESQIDVIVADVRRKG